MFGLCLTDPLSPGLLNVNLVVPEMLISFERQIPYNRKKSKLIIILEEILS